MTAPDTAEIRDLLNRYTDAQKAMRDGCGDGNCVVKKPRGMHTNGGCRCLYRPDHLTAQRAGHIMWLAQEMGASLQTICDAGTAREAAMRAEVERLREALDPNMTKAAYLGEIKMVVTEPREDEYGDLFESTREVTVDWSAIKAVMRMIAARAALAQGDR